MKVLVTGGAGFIGVSVINHFINDLKYEVLNVDKLTYAGNLQSLESVVQSPYYTFENVDILKLQIQSSIQDLALHSSENQNVLSPKHLLTFKEKLINLLEKCQSIDITNKLLTVVIEVNAGHFEIVVVDLEKGMLLNNYSVKQKIGNLND